MCNSKLKVIVNDAKKNIIFNPNYESVFATLNEGHTAYQKNYMVMAGFLVGLSRAKLDCLEYLPEEQAEQAKTLYKEIQTVIFDYSTKVGIQLQKLPPQIIVSLDNIINNNLIPALELGMKYLKVPISKDDEQKLTTYLTAAAQLSSNSAYFCGILRDNLNAFYNDNYGTSTMSTISYDLSSLVALLKSQSNDNQVQVQKLTAEIEELRSEVKKLSKAECASGISLGLTLFMGGSAVALLLASGAGAPLASIVGGVLAFTFAVGTAGIAGYGKTISKLQEQITSDAKEISKCDAAIIQLDTVAKTFDGFIRTIPDVIESVKQMQIAWNVLTGMLNKTVELINNAEGEIQNSIEKVCKQLDSYIIPLAKRSKDYVEDLDVSKLQVSIGNFNFAMSEEELKSEAAKAPTYDLVKFLLSA